MTAPREDTTDDSITDQFGLARRPLLKVLGTGTALSVGGVGAAAADEHEESETGEREGDERGADGSEASDDGESATRPRPPHVDAYYGYTTPDAGEVPGYLAPDHEVRMGVAPPANPEHPDRPNFFFFDPAGLQIQPGDVVQFTAVTPDHTVTAYHPGQGYQRRVPPGTPPFSSPVVSAGGAWLYQFERRGVYDLYCGPHHVLGMAMRIVVGDLSADEVPDYVDTFETSQGDEGPPLLAPFSPAFLERELNAASDVNEGCEWPWLTPAEILGTDALDPAAISGTNSNSMSFETVVGELGYDL